MSKEEIPTENVEEVEQTDTIEIEEVEVELSEVELLKLDVERLEKELEVEKNNFLKSHADLENTKRRLTNDFNQRDKYKNQSFMLSLLPAIDNMEKVLAEDEDQNQMREAIEMIYRQLKNSLEQEGVTEIKALNEKFDPNIHHAVMLETDTDVEADTVLEVLQKGYMLKDRVLRASMVKVSQ
ncbi:MAG: nucleotide exchange factor GrpE [Erysipelothrix sp.]|nr:nucleotide exchange factor GrpE [Erysipelothrix sp.]